MPSLPDSSSTAPSTSTSLEAGLTAFKQGNYAEAIVLLQSAPLAHVQAQMGLVIAYARTGEPTQAAALCRSLRQSDNVQLRQWAEKTLASLAKRFPQVQGPGEIAGEAEDVSGFVAFGDSSFLDQPAIVSSEETGFVPIVPADKSTIVPPSERASTAQDSTETRSLPRSPQFTPRTRRDRSEKSSEDSVEDSVGSSRRSIDQRSPQSAIVPSYQPVWRQAGRAKKGKSLGKTQWLSVVLTQVVTA
ncbi:MAG TPA: tetratricopeptide repeat protein, partial [Thermosynechococcaceae cyanobacterium]